MEENEFTHPGLRMIRDGGRLFLLVPVKAQRYRRLLHLMWFLIWMAGEAALVAGLLGWNRIPAPPRPVLIAFLSAFTIAGVYILYRLLWYMAGRETFVVTPTNLVAKREIWGIGHTRTFDRDKIQNLWGQRFNYEVVYPSWGRMFIGHGDGEILIESDGKTYAYGKGLEEKEARALADLMKQELNVRPRDRRPSEIRA